MELISVIIPTYNSAHYIKEAVDSALGQTYSEKEIIVIDDGSTDNTFEVLKPYIEAKKIFYLHQENKGASAARNLGIRSARGHFIAFLDSDDIFLPNKLKRQIDYLMEHPECGVCYCDIAHFYDSKPDEFHKLNYSYYSGDQVLPGLLRKNFINPLTVVIRKNVIDRVGFFDETYRMSEDWEYWIRLARNGVVFYHLPEVLARYRMRKVSLSYGWKSEIPRKLLTLRMIKMVDNEMTPGERKKYDMPAIIRMHRAKLWYAYAGTYFSPLRWIHKWLQKNRLASV